MSSNGNGHDPADPRTVPLRLEFSVEVPGTPEQVFDAIATTRGVSAWFLPTDVDGREGGAVVTHMGDIDSPGVVTGWDPPRRFVYEEPQWATLGGQDASAATPLASEFIVEATSGGTCVVRVVSSAYGTGAEWEREFIADLQRHWVPFFQNLRLYLTYFPGQQATSFETSAQIPGDAEEVWAAMSSAVGIDSVGGTVDLRGVAGRVEMLQDTQAFVRLDGSPAGIFGLAAFGFGGGTSTAVVRAWLFSEDAAAYVAREQSEWQAWLDGLAANASSGPELSKQEPSAPH
jgi:uncharacterized protein YndB with AHSA1/START domain